MNLVQQFPGGDNLKEYEKPELVEYKSLKDATGDVKGTSMD